MKQIVFERRNTAALWDVEDRMPDAGEVRIKMSFTAVSAGTERDSLTRDTGLSGAERNSIGGFPRMSGYSGSGVVENVGAGVEDLHPGDRVMVHGGGHKQYATLARGEVIQLPSEKIDMKDAALTIIAGFSLAAVRKARLELGESCMVVGLGLLGLFAVQYAKLCGASPVIAVDFSEERRALALKLGADCALDPSQPDHAQRVRALTGGRGANGVIEVTGNGNALNQALLCTARFGRVVLLGCTRDPATVDFYCDVHCPGIELIGAHSGARPRMESRAGWWTEMDDCAVTLKYLAAGRLNFHDMIQEVHSPMEAPEVYRRLCLERNFPIGVLFDWSQMDENASR